MSASSSSASSDSDSSTSFLLFLDRRFFRDFDFFFLTSSSELDSSLDSDSDSSSELSSLCFLDLPAFLRSLSFLAFLALTFRFLAASVSSSDEEEEDSDFADSLELDSELELEEEEELELSLDDSSFLDFLDTLGFLGCFLLQAAFLVFTSPASFDLPSLGDVMLSVDGG